MAVLDPIAAVSGRPAELRPSLRLVFEPFISLSALHLASCLSHVSAVIVACHIHCCDVDEFIVLSVFHQAMHNEVRTRCPKHRQSGSAPEGEKLVQADRGNWPFDAGQRGAVTTFVRTRRPVR
jgi:hypothetical protein